MSAKQRTCARVLAEAREEIDALNVYPVPVGDTGTNMYLTLVAARDAIREAMGAPDASRAKTLAALARLAASMRSSSSIRFSEVGGQVDWMMKRSARGTARASSHRVARARGPPLRCRDASIG